MLNKEKLNANKTTKFNCRGGRLCPPANKQDGITLIALIITIIVMLILVGVTINVAMNGGLFNTANEASTGTEEKTIYDQIVGAMVLTNEGKINVKDTFDKVVEIFGTSKVSPNTISDGSTEIQFEVTGKKGTYKYKITESEIKIDSTDIETNEYYYIENEDGTITITGPKKVIAVTIDEENAEKELNSRMTEEFGEETYQAYLNGTLSDQTAIDTIDARCEEIESEILSDDTFKTFTVVEFEESQVGTGGQIKDEFGCELYLPDTSTPLPSEIDGKKVTCIASNAFKYIAVGSSNFIPSTVISIGDYAFRSSMFVSQLIIPDSVQTIGKEAFRRLSAEGEVELIMNDSENNLVSIGDNAFEDNDFLKGTLNLRSEVTLGTLAFEHTQVVVNQN